MMVVEIGVMTRLKIYVSLDFTIRGRSQFVNLISTFLFSYTLYILQKVKYINMYFYWIKEGSKVNFVELLLRLFVKKQYS